MIDSTSFGLVTVDGRLYKQDVIVLSDGMVLERGQFGGGHHISLGELNVVLKSSLDVLVVGIGQNGMLEVSEDVRRIMRESDIELVEETTSEAIRAYNRLSQSRRVAAIIHVTC